VTVGIAHIKASFNNTTVTITGPKGELVLASGGTCAFKGQSQENAFAGTSPRSRAPEGPRIRPSRKLESWSSGRGGGRETRPIRRAAIGRPLDDQVDPKM